MRFLLAALLVTFPLFAAAAVPDVKATLRNAQGKTIGFATLTAAAGGVRVIVKVNGMAPGLHAFQVHSIGKCEAPFFVTAGGREQGVLNQDVTELAVDAAGTAMGEFDLHDVTLQAGPGSLFPEGSKAFVIQSAGARVACGVIERKG